MKVVNLTPHTINVHVNGTDIEIPASGIVARVSQTEKNSNPVCVNGIEIAVTAVEFGEIENLPNAQKDTVFLVSGLVRGLTTRKDVFSPNTGPSALRNDRGQVVAVQGFVGN